MAKILIVDDEERVRTILRLMLTVKGHVIGEAGNGLEALEQLEADMYDLVITDIRMDGLDGRGLLREIKVRNMGCPVVFITAFATLESAVEALRLGAADYLVKPFKEEQVHLAVERALGMGRLLSENVHLRQFIKQSSMDEDEGVFFSAAMRRVQDLALRVGPSETTVLITGESGTGKEIIAKLMHKASDLHEKRFVTLNCAAISPQLVESELFGHEKGAFTSAGERKIGKFEFAAGGTLFLDEIGELPLEAQAKLLRVIQERIIQRVGGNQDINVNIRLICATNQDLEKLVEKGRFRQDLYYRIAVFPIQVPPLRERQEAIASLATYFIKRWGGLGDVNTEIITPGAVQTLQNYSWPGNVRELANAMERVMILKAGQLPVNSDDLKFLQATPVNADDCANLFQLPTAGIQFETVQKHLVDQALERTAGNQSAAARLLGLTRAKFRTLLKLIEGS
jgi:DNA-binding NtrC family response regulator